VKSNMWFAVLLGVSISQVVTAGPSVTALIDGIAPRSNFEHNWKRCVGSGHMLLGTRADWRAHLKLAKNELGMVGIRGHGLLDDDMSVVPNKDQPPEFYNVDNVMDFLVENGIKPIVELSFMPKAFVTCGGENEPKFTYAFHDNGGYKGLQMPPDDFGDWYNLVKHLAEHLIDRYGEHEVTSWHFEVWNEMWGVAFPHPYMELYNASALALKAVNANLRVGGPATMQTLYVPEFIAASKAAKLPVDFVSTHYYPTDPQCQTNSTKGHVDCFADEVLAAQQHAAQAGLPFFLTEYNNGLGKTSRDDASAAAFVMRQVGLMNSLDLFSWWTFSDVFEEGWMRSAPFHNGYGLMTMQGTRKPAWRAFEMLAGAGSKRVPVSGAISPVGNSTVSVLATDGGRGVLGIQAFIANWHRVDAQRYACNASLKMCVADNNGQFTDEALCDASCQSGGLLNLAQETPDYTEVNLTIRHNLTGTRVTHATIYRIDSTHANPMGLWQKWGSPQYVTKLQITQLDDASKAAAETVPVQTSNTNEIVLTVNVPELSAMHIVF